MAKVRPGFTEISVFGPILAYMRRGSLQSRTGVVFVPTRGMLFLTLRTCSFDINIALVQTLYHGKRWTRISSNFRSRPYTGLHETGQLDISNK